MPADDMTHIVADGCERIMRGPTYVAKSQALRRKMRRRCAPLLANSSIVGKLFIHSRISRFIKRRLDKLAPPNALYSTESFLRDHTPHLTRR